MPVPYSQNDLKARFQLDDVPTEQDFADLIDTLLYLTQSAQETAAAAVALANAALAAGSAVTLFAGVWTHPYIEANLAISQELNISSISVLTFGLRFNFTVPYLNTNYVTVLQTLTGPLFTGTPTKTTTYFEIIWFPFLFTGPLTFTVMLVGQH